MANPRTIYSVIEYTAKDGEKVLNVEWNTDLYPSLAEHSPNGEFTDQIIDLAGKLMGEIDGE